MGNIYLVVDKETGKCTNIIIINDLSGYPVEDKILLTEKKDYANIGDTVDSEGLKTQENI